MTDTVTAFTIEQLKASEEYVNIPFTRFDIITKETTEGIFNCLYFSNEAHKIPFTVLQFLCYCNENISTVIYYLTHQQLLELANHVESITRANENTPATNGNISKTSH